jgi:ATP-dependent DNA helicase DinG
MSTQNAMGNPQDSNDVEPENGRSPLSTYEKNLIASVYRLLPEELPGFVGRQQQKDMIQVVASTYANESIALVEAPTGTGKSFGYQIPGIVLALSRDRRVIISTETASLQDQIYGRDLQVLTNILKKLDLEAPAVVAKGRERYVCPRNLEALTGQGDLLDEDDSAKEMNDIAAAWANGWDGQRDSLSFRVKQPIWAKVNNNRHACSNDACSHTNQCPHMAMKAKLKTSRIIVVNHSYLLATLAVSRDGDGGKKNPVIEFEKNYYAFDEGHHLHDRCIEAFSKEAVIDEEIMNEAGRLMTILGSKKVTLLKIRSEAAYGMGIALRESIRNLVGEGDMHRFLLGKVPDVLLSLVGDYMSAVSHVTEVVSEAHKDLSESNKDNGSRSSSQALIGSLGAIIGQLEDLKDGLEEFIYDGSSGRAKWIVNKKGICVIHASPFEAGGLAREMLWKHMRGAIVTSATLASLGEFGPTLSGLGLPKDTRTKKLTSPLNYSRSRMIVPRMIVEANSPGHGLMVTAILRKAAFNGEHLGGLAYFTSRKKMEAVYQNFTEEEKSHVLMQGHMAPTAMIAEHKRRIDLGQRSLILGLDSIAEGVDLPRAYCSLVFIDKLPFPSPDDPILASHSEHLEAKGLHPFPLLMLPRAGYKLAQIVGRLVRTEDDWGDVWLLDRRIIEKTYGQRLLKSTPFTNILQV